MSHFNCKNLSPGYGVAYLMRFVVDVKRTKGS